MPTSTDLGRGGPTAAAVPSSPGQVAVGKPRAWNAAILTKDWRAAGVAATIAIATALLLSQMPLVVALAAGAAIAVGLAYWAKQTGAPTLVLALVPTTMLAGSGLMPASTYFLPTATIGLSLVLHQAESFVRSRSVAPLPWRPLLVCAAVYILGALIATGFSIRPATSISYLVGIIIILVVTLWLGPAVMSSPERTASLFALIGAAGVAVTTISVLFSITGPFRWFDRWLGTYVVDELTLGGHPTGVLVLRTMGPFLAPGVMALALVPAILALLALRAGLGRVGRFVTAIALVFLAAGLLSTFARDGWLAVVVGSAILAFQHVRSRRIDLVAIAMCAVMTVAFMALYLNLVGADYRTDLTKARIPEAALIAGDPTGEGALDVLPAIPGATGADDRRLPTRGGSELSGRLEIWSASIRAIRDSPLIGYGPGTNAIVLDPYLSGISRRFVGLTSHNTWLRTWVELGFLGILGFAGFALVALIGGTRGRPTTPERRSLRMGALAMFVGLLAAQGFETFLLGGVSLPSFVWSMAAGLLALGVAGSTAREPSAT